MKILALSDFHGKFPSFIRRVIKKENVGVVVSVGDYPTTEMVNLSFKLMYEGKLEEDTDPWEVIGKNRYKELVNRDHENAFRVIDKLDKLSVPVISTIGNHDYPRPDDRDDRVYEKEIKWSWEEKRSRKIPKYIRKKENIKKIDYSYARIGEYVFVGMRGHAMTEKVKSKAYKNHRKILEEIFNKFRKENDEGKLIFVSHNSPYDTKLDKIDSYDVPEGYDGKHVGSKISKRMLKKWQPILSISGHIEEGKGKDKIGKTTAVNCGSVSNGDYVLIDLNDKTGKVSKVSFGKGK